MALDSPTPHQPGCSLLGHLQLTPAALLQPPLQVNKTFIKTHHHKQNTSSQAEHVNTKNKTHQHNQNTLSQTEHFITIRTRHRKQNTSSQTEHVNTKYINTKHVRTSRTRHHNQTRNHNQNTSSQTENVNTKHAITNRTRYHKQNTKHVNTNKKPKAHGHITNLRNQIKSMYTLKRSYDYRPPEGGRLYDMKVVSFCEPIMSRKRITANHAAAISHKY